MAHILWHILRAGCTWPQFAATFCTSVQATALSGLNRLKSPCMWRLAAHPNCQVPGELVQRSAPSDTSLAADTALCPPTIHQTDLLCRQLFSSACRPITFPCCENSHCPVDLLSEDLRRDNPTHRGVN